MKVLIAGIHHWHSPFQVGTHAIAREFIRNGWEVAHISAPITPLHRLKSRTSDLQTRMQIHRSGGEYEHANQLWHYVPFSLLAPDTRPILSSKTVVNGWQNFCAPNLTHLLNEKGFGKVNFLLLDNIYYGFLLDAIPHDRSALRFADNNLGFRGFGRPAMELQNRLINKVDHIFVASKNMLDQEFLRNKDIHYLPNGIDLERFENITNESESPLSSLDGPIAVYVGEFGDWFDFKLVRDVAEQLPHVTIALAGPDNEQIAELATLPNVLHLGTIAPELVPALLKQAQVGFIPFDVASHPALVNSIHPLKLYEYLAAGLSVVSTDWEELRNIPLPFHRASNREEFISLVAEAIDNRDDAVNTQLLQPCSWQHRLSPLLSWASEAVPRGLRRDLIPPRALVITLESDYEPSGKEAEVVGFNELVERIRLPGLFNSMFRHRSVALVTANILTMTRPFLIAFVLRIISRGYCAVLDTDGRVQRITFTYLLKSVYRLLRDSFSGILVKRRCRHAIQAQSGKSKQLNWSKFLSKSSPLYLRTDLWFGVSIGGSVAHISGVANSLSKIFAKPILLTSDKVPLIDDSIQQHVIAPGTRYWDTPGVPALSYNASVYNYARNLLDTHEASFVYQRMSLNNFAGALLAADHNLPFVLEYNGSEVWINRYWGRRLTNEKLALEIEKFNLESADLIVVVSEALVQSLVELGISSGKILVNPNGVDTARFHPDIDGSTVSAQYGLNEKCVIGFIGTFGQWHGARLLAESYVKLIGSNSELAESTRLLLIGDGPELESIKKSVSVSDISDSVITTGRIPQQDAPEYLACCDVLVSPTLPNPDGTTFFGSPTKLFEYMAMGKAIVSSNIGQPGTILTDNETALLVEPGQADQLAHALLTLINDPEMRERMGVNARALACENYTWLHNTQRIIDSLDSLRVAQ